MESEILLGCALTSLVGFILFAPLNQHRRWRQGAGKDDPRDFFLDMALVKIESTEQGPFLISMTFQGLLYPSAICWAWGRWSGTEAFLDSQGSVFKPGDPFGVRVFLYAFFGYLMNDLPLCWSNPLFRLHHLVCLVGIIMTLLAPESGVPFSVGIFTMELGSLVYNAWLIDETMQQLRRRRLNFWWPSSNVINVAYKVGMTASNVVGTYRMLQMVLVNFTDHLGFSIFFFVTGAPLLIFRQKEVHTAEKPASGVQGKSA